MRLLIILLIFAAAGCASQPPVSSIACTPIEVDRPVKVKAEPPAELSSPLQLAVPELFDPTAAGVTSCLAPGGEQQLLDLVDSCVTRVRAWEVWGAAPLEQ